MAVDTCTQSWAIPHFENSTQGVKARGHNARRYTSSFRFAPSSTPCFPPSGQRECHFNLPSSAPNNGPMALSMPPASPLIRGSILAPTSPRFLDALPLRFRRHGRTSEQGKDLLHPLGKGSRIVRVVGDFGFMCHVHFRSLARDLPLAYFSPQRSDSTTRQDGGNSGRMPPPGMGPPSLLLGRTAGGSSRQDRYRLYSD